MVSHKWLDNLGWCPKLNARKKGSLVSQERFDEAEPNRKEAWKERAT